MSAWWSGRVVAALSLVAAGLLLLSSLQQESPLRPTPLAIRRIPPAPLGQNELTDPQAAHKKLNVGLKEPNVGHSNDPAVDLDKDKGSVSKVNDEIDNEINTLDVRNVAEDRNVPEVGSVPQRVVPSEVQREASSAVLTEETNNTTQTRVINKTQVKDSGAGAVLTRSLYVSGHVWPAPAVCAGLGRRTRLAVLVTSAPAHGALRRAARHTWAARTRTDVALAFFIGLPPANLTADLEKERDLYGDIIMGNFVDSYTNLTLKTISMLEWITTYCPYVPRFLKTDDDMFINIPRLLDFLDARANATATIWGRVVRRWLPNRNPHSKYYLSRTQYPDKVFPTFATGPAYVVTRDAARALWGAALAPDVRFVALEDVAVTGIAAKRAKIRLVNAGEFVNKHVRPSACALRNIISLHMVSVELQLELWRKLHTPNCKG